LVLHVVSIHSLSLPSYNDPHVPSRCESSNIYVESSCVCAFSHCSDTNASEVTTFV
jgi:hypothetical protein